MKCDITGNSARLPAMPSMVNAIALPRYRTNQLPINMVGTRVREFCPSIRNITNPANMTAAWWIVPNHRQVRPSSTPMTVSIIRGPILSKRRPVKINVTPANNEAEV